MATAEVCRRHGISSATFYAWKSKYGGLEVSDAKRLRTLEDENRKLKKRARLRDMVSFSSSSRRGERPHDAAVVGEVFEQLRNCGHFKRPFAYPFPVVI
jgi:transposase-like protein